METYKCSCCKGIFTRIHKLGYEKRHKKDIQLCELCECLHDFTILNRIEVYSQTIWFPDFHEFFTKGYWELIFKNSGRIKEKITNGESYKYSNKYARDLLDGIRRELFIDRRNDYKIGPSWKFVKVGNKEILKKERIKYPRVKKPLEDKEKHLIEFLIRDLKNLKYLKSINKTEKNSVSISLFRKPKQEYFYIYYYIEDLEDDYLYSAFKSVSKDISIRWFKNLLTEIYREFNFAYDEITVPGLNDVTVYNIKFKTS